MSTELTSQLIQEMKRLHVFNSPAEATPSSEVSDLHLRATSAIEQMELIIDGQTPENALPYWRDYELMHRFVYNRPPAAQRINRIILTALDKKLKGDSKIDRLYLFRAIHHCLYSRRDPAYFGKAMSWYHATIQRSVDRQIFGKRNTPICATDTDTDIAILLTPGIDLYPWLGSKADEWMRILNNKYRS